MSARPDAREGQEGLLLLLADLLGGKTHDRSSAAKRLALGGPAAYAKLKLLAAMIPGVQEGPRGNRRVFSYAAPSREREQPDQGTVIAACFAASLAPMFEGSSYPEGMRAALEYIVRRSRRPDYYTNLTRKFWFVSRGGEAALREAGGRLDDLIQAILESRRIQFSYTRFGGEQQRPCVDPLSLVIHQHQLYLFAQEEGNNVRAFRFARMRRLELLDDTFEYPSRTAYDPEEILHDSFGVFISEDYAVAKVVVRLDPQWGTYVKTHRWHPTQRVARDGVTITFRVRVCPEVRAWISSFGDQIEVLEPDWLRTELRANAERTASRHSGAPTRSS